jgi:hypothetical protein
MTFRNDQTDFTWQLTCVIVNVGQIFRFLHRKNMQSYASDIHTQTPSLCLAVPIAVAPKITQYFERNTNRCPHLNNLFPPVLPIVLSTPSKLIPAKPAPPPSRSLLYLLNASLKCAGVSGPLSHAFSLSCKPASFSTSFHKLSDRSTWPGYHPALVISELVGRFLSSLI